MEKNHAPQLEAVRQPYEMFSVKKSQGIQRIAGTCQLAGDVPIMR
jgi:hypothetical protein